MVKKAFGSNALICLPVAIASEGSFNASQNNSSSGAIADQQ